MARIITVLSLALLTVSTVLGLQRAKDAYTAAFVAAAYVMLLVFLGSARELARLGRDAEGEKGAALKVLTWTLAAALNGMFSYRVAGMMPPPAATAVWALSGITTAGGFYVLFLYDARELRSR